MINPLFLKYTKIKNKTNPSKKASYNWDGCLYKLSICINCTDHGTDVSCPYSSEFIKFAILPKKIPIGATKEIISKYKNEFWLFFFAYYILAIIVPIRPPWNDIPPCQILKISIMLLE